MSPSRIKTILLAAAATLLLPMAPSTYADPPPWAPAHGWRKKNDPYYTGYSGRDWRDHYGIVDGRCNRSAVGAVLGGAVGGAIGSTVGKGDGRAVAIILGTVLGAVVGERIGRQMDEADRGCIGHALELAADRRTVYWTGANDWNYRVTPLRNFERDGMKCREYRLRVNGRGIDEDRQERACLVRPGEWRSLNDRNGYDERDRRERDRDRDGRHDDHRRRG